MNMRRYAVRWIEHHALEVEANNPEEAEEAAMGGDGMTDSSRTYCYAEIESIDEQAEQKEAKPRELKVIDWPDGRWIVSVSPIDGSYSPIHKMKPEENERELVEHFRVSQKVAVALKHLGFG